MSGSYQNTEVGDASITRRRTITEADVVNFAGVSGDFSSLHTDAERMRESQFGERIVHGVLVVAISRGLIWQSRDEALREDTVAFYGIDRLRFVNPVFFGDTIHAEIEVVDKEDRDGSPTTGIVRHDVSVVNQDGDVVVSYEPLLLVE